MNWETIRNKVNIGMRYNAQLTSPMWGSTLKGKQADERPVGSGFKKKKKNYSFLTTGFEANRPSLSVHASLRAPGQVEALGTSPVTVVLDTLKECALVG